MRFGKRKKDPCKSAHFSLSYLSWWTAADVKIIFRGLPQTNEILEFDTIPGFEFVISYNKNLCHGSPFYNNIKDLNVPGIYVYLIPQQLKTMAASVTLESIHCKS